MSRQERSAPAITRANRISEDTLSTGPSGLDRNRKLGPNAKIRPPRRYGEGHYFVLYRTETSVTLIQ